MSTDDAWEQWGEQDPFFAVITHDKYRRENLSDDVEADFFRSGKPYFERILNTCKKKLDPSFSPRIGLDFGCGVGRITFAMAKHIENVTGLDVADSMLEKAKQKCEEIGLTNVSFLKSDDQLSGLVGQYDFIHSFIVFQHIPVLRGRGIFGYLINHLSPKGIAVVHFTYAKSILSDQYGVDPALWVQNDEEQAAPKSGFLQKLRRGGDDQNRALENKVPGKDPEMQMNSYNLNELLFLMQAAGVKNFYTEFTDHGGELGVMLYFQKPV